MFLIKTQLFAIYGISQNSKQLISCFFLYSFAVNEKELLPLIEYCSLDDVLKDKKLFIVDYRILDGIKGMPNKTVICTS